LSINRFEAKKNIALAIDTFVQVQKQYAALGHSTPLRLILAGGYDYRMNENIITLRELQEQCDSNSLKHLTLFYNKAGPSESSASSPPLSELNAASVIFLPSAPFPLLGSLLIHPQMKALLYTPTDEHFGIVPLEAMAVGLPVLATNTGGPMESVLDLSIQQSVTDSKESAVTYANKEGTGLLRRSNPTIWAKATLDLIFLDDEQRSQISQNAKERTKRLFSMQSMSKEFERCIAELAQKGNVRSDEGLLQWSVAIGSES
jgi:alpha-1,3/alpha-1,6-mannosyltransferase